MNLEQAIATINSAMQAQLGRQLSDIETLILEGAWQGRTYPQIAEATGYSINYLTTDIGPKFWKVLSNALGESVNKKNFKAAIQRFSNSATSGEPVQQISLSASHAGVTNSPSIHTDWGEAPDIQQFYGRAEEQAMLTQWIVRERCRLVAVLGMGGIGKSTLATTVVQHIIEAPAASNPSPFEVLIWRSLRNSPSLSTLLSDLIDVLSDHQDTGKERSQLLHWLREKRCLIVLDNVETILQAGEYAGYYREGYEAYGELIRMLGETPHQSCVVLTSREKPVEIAALEGVDGCTRTLQLSGSMVTALALMQAKGLKGTLAQQQALCDRYSYNPLALKIVSTTIQDLFGSDIGAFLVEDAVIFNSIRRLLDEQFQRLTELEQTLMVWLAINRDWTEIGELAADILPSAPKVQVLEALESLKWRGLIESRERSYTQQPVVMEYVTQRLVQQVSRELTALEYWTTATFSTYALNTVALCKTTVKDFIRQSQERLILYSIIELLQGIQLDLAQHLRQCLSTLQRLSLPLKGYAAGNLINLCRILKTDFKALDLSQLYIRHAYLQDLSLHQVNLAQSEFHETAFNQPLGPIFHVAYSPSGALLAAGEGNGRITIWETVDYKPVLILQASTNWIMALDFSADSKLLVSEGIDHSLNVWDTTTGKRIKTLPGHAGLLWVIKFSPIENVLVSAGIDCTLLVWDLSNLDRFEPIHHLNGHTQQVNTATFSPDGRWLISGGADNTLRLWDRHTGEALKTWNCDAAPLSVRFSPDGTFLAIGYNDGTIRLWNWQTEQTLMSLQAHKSWVMSVRFSACGRYLASGSADTTSKLWDVKTGKLLRTAAIYGSWIWSIAFSPDSRYLAVSNTDHTVRLWTIPNKDLFRSLQGFASWVTAVAVHPHHPLLASASEAAQIHLWHRETGKLLRTLTDHTDWVMAVVFSPCGRWIAGSSSDRTLRIWDVNNGNLVHTLTGHTASLWSISFSPDGQRILSGSFDLTLKLWDVETGALLQTLVGHKDWIYPSCFSQAGKYLASSGIESLIYLWDANSGTLICTLPSQQQSTWALAFSPDDHLLAAGGEDTTVNLWEVSTGRLWKTLHSHNSSVRDVTFSPNGELLASCSDDHTIKLWLVSTGELITTLTQNVGRVNAIAFSPDGQTLVSGSTDETVRLWDLTSMTCTKVLQAPRPYENMNITGVAGLTSSQIQGLIHLGALDNSRPLKSIHTGGLLNL
jgi:WD40 repeat protein